MDHKFEENIHEKSSEYGIYYKKLADKYRVAKILVLILLAVFFIFTALFFSQDIRAIHFRYLIKFFDVNPMTLDQQYEDIAYAVGGNSQFALFRDDLAVLGEGMVSLYNLTGDLEYRSSIKNGNLAVDAEGKYLAAYVLGDRTLSLFHSFGKETDLTFSGSISSICISKKGTLAVCLNSQKETTIHCLDSSFELQHILNIKGGAVIDMAISNDGKRLSVLSIDSTDGTYCTHYELWDLKNGELLQTETFPGRKPIATCFFENDRFSLIFDRAIRFCSKDGTVLQTIATPSNPSDYCICENKLLFLSDSDEVIVYQSDGKKQTSFAVPQNILDIKIHEDDVYLLLQNTILIYDNEGNLKETLHIESGVLSFYILDDNSLLLCYASETKRISQTK